MTKKVLLPAMCALVLAIPVSAQAIPLMTETIIEDFFFLGDFHTYEYSSHVDIYTDNRPSSIFDGYWIGTEAGYDDHLSWYHTLPTGLQVPPDVVTRAKLWIDAYRVDDNDNLIAIQGTWDWDPLNNRFLDNSTYDLMSLSDPLWNGGQLGAEVWAGENRLRIDHAILMMDVDENGQLEHNADPTNPVPEPTTLVLLGAGLISAAGIVRRRQRA